MLIGRETPKYKRLLESELELAIRQLKSHVTGTEEYKQTLECIERLHVLMDDKTPSRVSPEVRATVAANLIGILMILKHEHVNVITSKALGFIIRPR